QEAWRLVREQTYGELGAVYLDFRRYAIVPGRQIRHYSLTQPLLLDMAKHHIDLMRYVLGQEPVSVYCRAWNPPWSPYRDPASAAATVELSGGTTVSYRGSWVSPGPRTAWAGEWRMECAGGEVAWTSRSDLKTPSVDRVSARPIGKEERDLSLPEVKHQDRVGALAEFVAAVSTGREPESSARENLQTLALAFAAVESARTGAPVTLAE
ncbi:MAG: Gfo/Idh/MocA family oxidoreductase, partial [Chloroflexota bacterium]|nr:Gfo/Idh/MocA family oxidoreductase [Chloroflexota bacterium]